MNILDDVVGEAFSLVRAYNNIKYRFADKFRTMLAVTFIVFMFFAQSVAQAQFQLPQLFSNGVVLQRDLPIPVWGTAESGADVIVTLNGVSGSTQVATDGTWRIDLPAMNAGGPYTMTVTSGIQSDTFTDIYIGDVWLASGQSNMEWTINQLPNASDIITTANYQQIRQFKVPKSLSNEPSDRLPAGSSWTPATSNFVGNFTAVGYFFAGRLREHMDVPIGIINASYGGSRIEAWLSEEMLGYDEQDSTLGNGAAQQQPTVAYNAMIHPILPFPIKGFLWYQGESNAFRAEDVLAYVPQFQTLIQGWRELWTEGDLPFLWVQLPNFGPLPGPIPSPNDTWPLLRASQESALALPNTGQAITIDVGGEDIHPPDKEPVGYRLSLIARKVAYGEDIIYSGPRYQSNNLDETGRVHINFTHVDGGLAAGEDGTVGGFAIAGRNGGFVRADAVVEGDQVVVWSTAVPNPRTLRYAWENNPVDANLYNSEELPAAPFEAHVYPGFKIAWFNALRTTIEQGQSTTLEWEVFGASSVTLDGAVVDSFATMIIAPDETTAYTLMAVNRDDPNIIDIDTISVEVLDPLTINRTLGQPATASTFEMCCSIARTANFAVDGNMETRWSSAWSDGSNNANIDPNLDDDPGDEWIMVDLGSPVDIERVVLSWGDAYASIYDLDVSFCGYLWTSAHSNTSGDGGEDSITFDMPVIGRYIRIHCKERATTFGYSLFEIAAYGKLSTLQPPMITVGSSVGNVVTTGATVQLLANASDSDGTVAQVTFYIDGEVLNADNSAPFEGSWTPDAPGTFIVTAIATDNSNFSVQAALVQMYVVETGSMTRYEAENAATTGDTKQGFSSVASGRLFLEMYDDCTITWSNVEVPASGEYLLSIRYQLPYSSPKHQFLVVNGDTLEVIEFRAPNTTSWLNYGVWVHLEPGTNEIAVHGFWNWMNFDYIDVSNDAIASAVEDANLMLPSRVALSQNYPNPFNPTTTIRYQLPTQSDIDISIFNLLGEKVATLVSKKQIAGNYEIKWDASNFASGVYFYRLKTDKGFSEARRLVLLK